MFPGPVSELGDAAALALPGSTSGAPRWSDLVTQWRPDPVCLALLVAAVAWYASCRVRLHAAGGAWLARRDATFAFGVALAVWVTCGVAQARAGQIEWVWMAQLLALLLVIPLIVLAGQPLQLARQVGGERSTVPRALRSRPLRILGHPLVGPALVPVTFLVLLYGGVGELAAASTPVGWPVHALLLLLGGLIALPLVDATSMRTSLAVGLAMAVGLLELIMDIFPGLALRLASHPVISYFATHTPGWAGGWLYQQHQSGGLLWIALEILDLPFVILLAIRWVRVDAAEAARVDDELGEQQPSSAVARAAADALVTGKLVTGRLVTGKLVTGWLVTGTPAPDPGESAVAPDGAPGVSPPAVAAQSDRPWFLDDPQLRDRFRS